MSTPLRFSIEGGFSVTILEALATELSKQAIPESWCRGRNQEQKDWIFNAHQEFALDLHKRLLSTDCYRHLGQATKPIPLEVCLTQRDLIAYGDVAPTVLEASWKTCQDWSERVDAALYSHQERKNGIFLFVCSINPSKLSSDQQTKLVRDAMALRQKEHDDAWLRTISRSHQLESTINIVQQCDATISCWECGRLVAETSHLKACSQCQVALYCGRECQVKAWKSGHKHNCKILAETWKSLDESLQLIQQTCENGSVFEDTQVNIRSDVNCFALAFQHPSPYRSLTVDDDEFPDSLSPQGPSIKFFYQNLTKVKQGHWWVFPDTLGLEAYRKKLGHKYGGAILEYNENSSEAEQFRILYMTLCYDIDGFLDMIDPPSVRQEIRHTILRELIVRGETKFEKMPAERFIEIYSHKEYFHDKFLPPRAVKRYLNNVKTDVLAHCKEVFHKKQP
ncbi:MAG: hypothetical protein SGILL_010444 [Bacillariaceae sp.]